MTATSIWPAALRLDQAAEYSGLSVETFKAVCPVKPIKFTLSTKGNRYLRTSLDAWLASLDPNKPADDGVESRHLGQELPSRAGNRESSGPRQQAGVAPGSSEPTGAENAQVQLELRDILCLAYNRIDVLTTIVGDERTFNTSAEILKRINKALETLPLQPEVRS